MPVVSSISSCDVQLSPAQSALREYLERIVALRSRAHRGPRPPYLGIEDLLLQHGRWYDPPTADWSFGHRFPDTPTYCYQNCYESVRRWPAELRYVEGMGISKFGIPMLHAWLIDSARRVVDPTWGWDDGEAAEGALFGLVFPLSALRARRKRDRSTFCMLDDFDGRWPLLKAPFPWDALQNDPFGGSE